MILKLFTLTPVTIDTAGTREAISGSSVRCKSVIISADSLNTGKVYVGDSSVSSTNGVELSAGEDIILDADYLGNAEDELDLSDIYVDTASNGNKVRIQYFTRKPA